MRELTSPETAQLSGGNLFAPLGVTYVLDYLAEQALHRQVQAQMDQVMLEMQKSMSGYDMSES